MLAEYAVFNLTSQVLTSPDLSLIKHFSCFICTFHPVTLHFFYAKFHPQLCRWWHLFLHPRYPQKNTFFQRQKVCRRFLTALAAVQGYHHFDLVAYCILPDHIHILITLAESDFDFSSRIKEIKKKTTTAIRLIMNNPLVDVWQSRFWEHTIKDQDDFQHCFDYIHYNPIKHGYSDTFDWEWSSFCSYYGIDPHVSRVIDPKEFHESLFSYGE